MKITSSIRASSGQGHAFSLKLCLGIVISCSPPLAFSAEDEILPGLGVETEEAEPLTPLAKAVYNLSFNRDREDDYRWADVLNARIEAGEPLPPWHHAAPPADEAMPVRHLAYWCRFDETDEAPEPSAVVREKLLAAVQMNPSRLATLLRFLPQTEDAGREIAAMLELLPREFSENRDAHRKARVWAYRRSGLCRDEVIADAVYSGSSRGEDDRHQESALAALREREPGFAKVLATHLTHTPDPEVAARAAVSLLNPSDADLTPEWRDWLIGSAGNPELPARAREIATEALFSVTWKDRDSWSINLFTNGDGVEPGWFFDAVRNDKATWIPRLSAMIGGTNRRAHERSARLLSCLSPEQDTLRPLLPWLDDPAWVGTPDHYDRMGFLDSFGEVRLPEAIPRLERALSNKTDSWETARIAYALAFHQAQHAVPAMKAALAGCEGSACASIVSSIQSLGGFSQDEIFGAVEHFFITCPSDENRQDVVFDREDSPKDPRIWIGACFIDEPPWNQQWFDKLSSRVIETVSRQPAPASGLLDLMLLMKKGDVSPAAAALLAPQQLSAWQLERILPRVSKPGWNPVPFRPLLGKKGALGGFAAVLASDRKSIDAILEGDDVMALRAVLAAASLVKGAVTPQQVLPLLGSKEEEVASAAVEYLRYGDREARRAFLLHKRATAGGDDVSWDPEKGNYGEYQKTVGRAMDQFNLPTGPDEVFELSQTAQGGIRGNWTVLGYKDSGIVFHEERGGRSGFAKLDKERMERFRDYVTRYRVDELPPLVQPIMDGVNFAYTHTRGENSSRVFMNNPPGTDPSLEPSAMVPTGKERYSKGIVVYGGLVNLFDILLEELPFTWAFGGVGEEVLVPREKAEIVSVWKQDDDLRVLVWDRMGVRYWMGVDPDTRSLTGLVAPPFLPATEWYVDRYSRKLTRLDPEKPTNTYDLPLRTLQSSSEGGLWIVDGESIYESTGSGIRPTTGIFRLSPTESRGRPLASIRGLNLASEATWVDEAEGMVYAAVDGNLVRIPVRF